MGSLSSKPENDSTATLLYDENQIIISPISSSNEQQHWNEIDGSSSGNNIEKDYDIIEKVVICGNSGVGKSCFAFRISGEGFYQDLKTTIGADFRCISTTEEDVRVKLQFWDTAGQERYRTITSAYYRGASVVLLFFDLTKAGSLSFLNYFESVHLQHTHILIIGTKKDLISKIELSRDDILKSCKQIGIENAPYFEISNLTGESISEVITHLTKYAANKVKQQQQQQHVEPIQLSTHPTSSSISNLTHQTPTKIVVKKRKAVKRDQSFTKSNIEILSSSKGIRFGEEKGFWCKIFPNVFIVDNNTCFKIDQEHCIVEIDNMTSHIHLYLTKHDIFQFIKEWKQVYYFSQFQNITFKQEDLSKIYKMRCDIVGVRPALNVVQYLDSIFYKDTGALISEEISCRGLINDLSAKERKAVFSTLIWIHNITSVDLGNNNLTDQDVKELCYLLHGMHNISSLNLSNNPKLTIKSCLSISEMLLQRDSFEMISLSGCPSIKDEGAISILSCNNIRVVEMCRCELGDVIIEKLVQVSKNQSEYSLQQVQLMMNNIDTDKLLKCLKNHHEFEVDVLTASQTSNRVQNSALHSSQPQKDEVKQHQPEKYVITSPNTTTGINNENLNANAGVANESHSIVLKNRYCVEKKIGRGGFGAVYLALDQFTQQQIAVKVIEFDELYDLEKSFNEISNHQKLTHDHIVDILDFGIQALEKKLYLILPIYKEGDLHKIISKQTRSGMPFHQNIICCFLLQSALSLNYMLEKHKLIHGDIKPANFLVDEFSNDSGLMHCALNDFGFSLQVPNKSRYVSEVGRTPFYAAPEQNEGKGIYYKSDIFALGVTACEMMSLKSICVWKLYKPQTLSVFGEVMYDMMNDDEKVLLEEQVKQELRKQVEENYDYNSLLIDLVLEMLSFNPANRPSYDKIISTVSQLL